MTIRKLRSYEVPGMLRGAELFASASALPGGLKPEVFVRNWVDLIDNGAGVVFAMFGPNEQMQGALGAVKFPDPFNGDLVAVENYWFVIPEFRGRGVLLLKEFEQWAKEEGCKRIAMIHLQRLQPEQLKDFYTRLGYEHIESNYIKAVA